MKNTIYISIIPKDDIIIDNHILFPNNIKREETKKAYTLLKNMLEQLNIPFDINNIYYQSNGKPYLKNSSIKFNYSHSKHYIACCISNDNIGIDIEDECNISKSARDLYLKGITKNYRKSWVIKEAYCKLLGDFNDEIFKNIDIYHLKENHKDLSSKQYDCILFYEGEKEIKVIGEKNHEEEK